MISRAGLLGLFGGTILSRGYFNSAETDAFFGFVLAALLVGVGYRMDRPREEGTSGCFFTFAAFLLCVMGAGALSYVIGQTPAFLLVPPATLILVGWASPSGMPLWHLLGLLVWTGLSYSRLINHSPGVLALLLVIVTVLFVAVSGLRRKFPWLEPS